MIKNKKSLKGSKTPSRRKFFKAAAATGAAAATAVAMPNVAFGAPQTLKMQAAWPSGANIFFESFRNWPILRSIISRSNGLDGRRWWKSIV